MANHKISVSEALRRIETGESVRDCSVDFDHVQVEALVAFKLSKAGIEVPETVIFYDDDDIAYDEAFEGDWVRVDTAASDKTQVRITLQDDLKQWVQENNVPLEHLIEQLLDGFYRTQKMLVRKS
ncbi:MAG: hypothetical protein LCH81_12885 [Bacteroidetes bacterium]|nr:hypothetical protein [Bacteroidota bacterium]